MRSDTFTSQMMPHLGHSISITEKETGKTIYVKQYSGGPVWGGVATSAGKGGHKHWSTYRWQLEAFVSKVRGREPACWVSNEESIVQMETIDMIYEKSGLGARPSNSVAN